jgi:hydroxymethylglutaryl-CoA lyase
MIKLTECPRDAIQGIKQFIDTDTKAKYINQLLKVGFYAIDFGSFVSPDVIPQMADTHTLIEKLDTNTHTKLIAIVANERGAREACEYERITYLGYPFSISETFQLRNTNATILESLERVKVINELCQAKDKEMIIYISMGFGNKYGDPYSPAVVEQWVDKLAALGIRTVMLSDTVGVANPLVIKQLFETLIPRYPAIDFGAHLHTAPHNWKEKIQAAYNAGCIRFDSVIRGFGGCPMAEDDLIGNMPTENLMNFFDPAIDFGSKFSLQAFENSLRMSREVYL